MNTIWKAALIAGVLLSGYLCLFNCCRMLLSPVVHLKGYQAEGSWRFPFS